MHCQEFLERYSEYRDEVIADLGLLARVDGHLAVCRACQQYDAVVRRGVAVLRADDLEPTGVWKPPRDLSVLEDAGPVAPTAARFLATLMLAAGLTSLVWEGTGRTSEPAAEHVSRPSPVAVASPGIPFVRFVDRESEPAAGRQSVQPALTLYQPPPDR